MKITNNNDIFNTISNNILKKITAESGITNIMFRRLNCYIFTVQLNDEKYQC